VTPGTLAVGLMSRPGAEQERAVLADVRRVGGKTLQIGGPAPDQVPGLAFPMAEDLSDVARGLLAMPVLQLIAYYRAVHLGLNPDQPRNLSQVVVLQEADLSPAG